MSRFVAALAFAFLGLFCAAAAAADDPYVVRNVHVDASAVSATEALNQAIAQGRPHAWQTVFRRLTRQQDWAKQPQLDDLAIQRLMKNYTVANERRSTTRYTADVTYIFNPDQVHRVMRQSMIGYTDSAAKRILIVPMAPGYARNAPWTVAWSNPKVLGATSVPLVLPNGDGADMAVLGRLNFDKATWNAVATMANRAQAAEVALLQLSAGTVKIHHLAPTPIPDNVENTELSVPGNNLVQAAALTANALEDYWKARSSIDYSHHGHSTVTARFDSLGDWTAMLAALTAVSTVSNVEVVAIDSGEARLGVTYVGSLDLVHDALARTRVSLDGDEGSWRLEMAAAKSSQ